MLKRHLVLVALLALAVVSVLFVACDDNQAEEGQAIFGVSDINGNEPVVVSGGAGSTVDMTFRWRPYFDPEGTIVEAAPHGDYTIESYRVTWTAVTSGATVPSPRDEATHIFLPVYDLVQAGVILLTPAESASVTAGSVLNVNVEFTAREMGTTRDAKFSTKFSVTFN
jgi:hypothetical protein